MECTTELRPFKDPTYDLMQVEHEISIQAVQEVRAVPPISRPELDL